MTTDPQPPALTTLDQVVEALRAIGADPLRRGDRWFHRCAHPDHNDSTPSASVTLGRNGQVLFSCFGCPGAESGDRTKWVNEVRDRLRAGTPKDPADPSARGRSGSGGGEGRGVEVAQYEFVHADTGQVFVKRRFETEAGRKTFEWQRVTDTYRATGLNGAKQSDLRPFGDVGDLGPVLWLEGERGVEAALAEGWLALSGSGGSDVSSIPRDDILADLLAGRDVLVVADRDEPGVKFARAVAEAVTRAGAASVRVVQTPVEGKGADLVEHIEADLRLEDLIESPAADAAPLVGKVLSPAPVTGAWFDRDRGLRAKTVAESIMNETPMAVDGADSLWVYNSGVWRLDEHSATLRRAVVARLSEDHRKRHQSDVAETVKGLAPIIDPGVVGRPDLINVANGMLEWRTGRLLAHDPEFLSVNQLPVSWDPDAVCPTIDGWLTTTLPADLLEPLGDHGASFIDMLLAYLILLGNPLHKAMLMLGRGRNGKGTFLRLVTALLGLENCSAVTLHDLVSNRFRAAELYGRLANIAGDLDGGWLTSTAMFKMVTGGDTIGAERKFGQPFSFTPQAVPVFSANAVFGTPDTSAGYMSRWVLVPFPNSFAGREDRSLDARLQVPAELQGLLVRAVRALPVLMDLGNFPEPPSVEAARLQFEEESDPVRSFLAAVSEPDPNGWATRAELKVLYDAWVAHSGTKALASAKLWARIEEAGVRAAKRDHGTRGFVGRRVVVRVAKENFEAVLVPLPGAEARSAAAEAGKAEKAAFPHPLLVTEPPSQTPSEVDSPRKRGAERLPFSAFSASSEPPLACRVCHEALLADDLGFGDAHPGCVS